MADTNRNQDAHKTTRERLLRTALLNLKLEHELALATIGKILKGTPVEGGTPSDVTRWREAIQRLSVQEVQRATDLFDNGADEHQVLAIVTAALNSRPAQNQGNRR